MTTDTKPIVVYMCSFCNFETADADKYIRHTDTHIDNGDKEC